VTDPADVEAHTSTGYRALGRYIAEFSRLILVIRDLMVERLRKPDDPPQLAALPFGGVTAEPIATAFFGMCRMLMEHDHEEDIAARKLRRAVVDQIERRNRVAHGDWYIGYWSRTGGPEPGDETVEAMAPWVERLAPGRKAGPWSVSSEDLDKESEALVRLRTLVHEYGWVCFGRHRRAKRVSDVLVVEDEKAEFGPLASRYEWII
jgi:hypothetical protein